MFSSGTDISLMLILVSDLKTSSIKEEFDAESWGVKELKTKSSKRSSKDGRLT